MTQTDRIVQTLREEILGGNLRPGSPIRQQSVADSLKVSRVPVREALRQLEAEGLVMLTPFSGARVSKLDFEECLEIYKIRERLEPLAFSESAARLSKEQVGEIREAAEQVERSTSDHGRWLAADRQFHLLCYAGVNTPRLTQMIVNFWNTTQRYRRILLTTFTEDDFELAHYEHRLMVNALVIPNPRGGEDLVRLALERSRLRLSANRDLFDNAA